MATLYERKAEAVTKPSIISTNKPLPFGELSPLEFERMCLWLVEREGYLRPQHLGEAGSEQGRDVVAYKPTDAGEELWYFQCKRYQRINAATLKKEVDKYNELAGADPAKRPDGIVFVTNAVVSARVRDDVAAYCRGHGYAYDFWAHTELDMRVKTHPDVVQEFFDASSELVERFVQEVKQHLEKSPPSALGVSQGTPTRGIPQGLLASLRRALIDCDEFYSPRQLRSVFEAEELKPWRDGLPFADNVGEQVDIAISYLVNKRRSNGENVLAILLRALGERYGPADERRDRLLALADQIE